MTVSTDSAGVSSCPAEFGRRLLMDGVLWYVICE